jgi:aryl-alcohol dehydrogenase-like predicted oxidoreductase
VSRRQANRWADQADQQYYEQQQYQQQAAAAAAPPPQAAPGLGADTVEQLKQLAELRDQGILTDEEFNAQKAKILAS